MSFDALHAEVLHEFAAFVGYRERFDQIRDSDVIDARLRELNRNTRWRRALPESRAKAVETTREWRRKMLADPVTAAELRAKRAAQAKRWRLNNPEKYAQMRRGIEARRRAKIYRDKKRHEALKARNAAAKRRSRGKS